MSKVWLETLPKSCIYILETNSIKSVSILQDLIPLDFKMYIYKNQRHVICLSTIVLNNILHTDYK